MKEILVSVITTVKNGEQYILETCESVRAQTYTHFEHIIVDDGSTDSTITILKRFAQKHPEYKLILFEPGNLGRGKALNYAVSKAKGEWIAIIDADDIWHPEKLEVQYEIIKNNSVDVLGTFTGIFNHSNEIEFSSINNELHEDLICLTKNKMLISNSLNHSSVLMRRELAVYDENRKSQYDFELWLRLLDAKKILAVFPFHLAYHRIHENQSFESKMKRNYRWRAFKLKMNNIQFPKQIHIAVYVTLKLMFDMVMPRSIRLLIRNVIKEN